MTDSTSLVNDVSGPMPPRWNVKTFRNHKRGRPPTESLSDTAAQCISVHPRSDPGRELLRLNPRRIAGGALGSWSFREVVRAEVLEGW
jgi:hypothetical protein